MITTLFFPSLSKEIQTAVVFSLALPPDFRLIQAQGFCFPCTAGKKFSKSLPGTMAQAGLPKMPSRGRWGVCESRNCCPRLCRAPRTHVEGNGPAWAIVAFQSHHLSSLLGNDAAHFPAFQDFKISKCEVNVDHGRLMGVSLCFSRGDKIPQLWFGFCCRSAKSQKSLQKQTQVSPSSCTTGKPHTQTLLHWGQKHEQGFGEGARSRAVGTSSASIGDIQLSLERSNIYDFSCQKEL